MATERHNAISPLVRVTVQDIDIPFWSLVLLLIRLAVAAIPAAIFVTILVVAVTAIVGGALGSFGNPTVQGIATRPTAVQQARQAAPPIDVSKEIQEIQSLLSEGKYHDAYGRVTALQREKLSAAERRTAVTLQNEAWKGISGQP